MMGLFANHWSNTLKLFNFFRTLKTPHLRVSKRTPPTIRVPRDSSESSSTYQGMSMGSTSIKISIEIYPQEGPYITINKLPSVWVQYPRHHMQGFQGIFQRYHTIFKRHNFHGLQAHHTGIHH